MRLGSVFLVVLLLGIGAGAAEDFSALSPRPTGQAEAGAPPETMRLEFSAVQEDIGVVRDVVAYFPKEAAEPFRVAKVEVNGEDRDDFLVRNEGVFNGNRIVHGSEDFSVAVYAAWDPGKEYKVTLAGLTEAGKAVELSVSAAAPESRDPVKGAGFGTPTAARPYHHMTLTLAKEDLAPGTVTRVEIDGVRKDGKFCHFVEYANTGLRDPRKPAGDDALEGVNHDGRIEGSRDLQITAPCAWVNGSAHTIRATVQWADGGEAVFEKEATAPGSGGHWNAAWPHHASVVLQETAGVLRQGDPVHLELGLFADDLGDATKDIRVVTYDPTSPKAGADGYVVAPCQIVAATEWRDEAMLNHEERDAESGELVKRYDPTTTVELLFLAEMQPYQEKVYQVLYGNPSAEAESVETDLSVTAGEGLGGTVANDYYSFSLAGNSGAVETVTVLGEGEPVLLEHKLETNGAVHWNPGCYAPPTPWVHVSDWEAPDYDQISGPLMHRTRRYAPLPHMTDVAAHISYTFYAGQPYVLMSSLMEVKKDIFVKALRNSEIVFNHAVLDEFVWEDPLGTVRNMLIEGSREHPIHALEIPADTPWMAFISRRQGVGFAAISLAYENTNLYGDPVSLAQPYIYVQNGPWIYWSRPLVYPFGGQNLTRVMRARKGSLYLEEIAWVPFRLKEGGDPFEDIKRLKKQLTHPLEVREWMPIDARTPDKWVMPILTMPFDEGVAGAVSGHKEVKE